VAGPWGQLIFPAPALGNNDPAAAGSPSLDEEPLSWLTVLEEPTAALDGDIRNLADAVTGHAETVLIGLPLAADGADVRYLDRLHAKVLARRRSACWSAAPTSPTAGSTTTTS
jgi:hypothetical protein